MIRNKRAIPKGGIYIRYKNELILSLFSLIFAVFSVSISAAEENAVIFSEDFKHGTLNLNWLAYPFFSQNSVKPILDTTTPEGDVWAGRLTNEQLGGFASLSYAGTSSLQNYSMEAWVYVAVVPNERAPINGICVRVDPENNRFYRFGTHFDSKESRLTFAYVGSDNNNYPAYIGSWEKEQIPGRAPSTSGWHRMGVICVGNEFWVYWDGRELPGCPLKDERISQGFFGIYATYVGGKGIIETRVDGIEVKIPKTIDSSIQKW